MLRIAMARKYYHLVAPLLQAYSSVDHEALGAADSQVGMEEDDSSGIVLNF